METTGQKRKEIGLTILQEFKDNVQPQNIEVFKSRYYLNDQSLKSMLYPPDINLIGKGYREGLLFKRADQKQCLLIEALENKDVSDDGKFSQFSTLHEALFWMASANKFDIRNYAIQLELLEKTKKKELESKHAQLLVHVYEIECKMLTNLEELRNTFCNKLSDRMNWKQMLINVYCKMTKDLLEEMSEKEIGFDQVYRILEKIGFVKDATDQNTQNAIRIAHGHAYLLEYLEKEGDEGALSFEFAKNLNILIEGVAKHEVNKKGELSDFLGWINGMMKSRSIDIVTLAAISHCGVIKMQAFKEGNHRTALLVQNFVLLKNCYPAMAMGMGTDEIKKFKEIFDKGKAKGNYYLRGCDISPSMRFFFKCMDNTLVGLLDSMKKAQPEEESTKKEKMEAGKVVAPGGSMAHLEEESSEKKKTEARKLVIATTGGSSGLDKSGIEESRASPTGTDFGPCSPMHFEIESLEEDEIVDTSITKEPGAKRMKLSHEAQIVAQTPSPPPLPYVQFGTLIKEALHDFNKHLLEYPKELVVKEPAGVNEEFLKKWGLLSGQ